MYCTPTFKKDLFRKMDAVVDELCEWNHVTPPHNLFSVETSLFRKSITGKELVDFHYSYATLDTVKEKITECTAAYPELQGYVETDVTTGEITEAVLRFPEGALIKQYLFHRKYV